MALNIIQSDKACTGCVKNYAKKHKFKKGRKCEFEVDCTGIPKSYTSAEADAVLPADMSPDVLLDPVTWAAKVLDWHCLDPDSSVWQRKEPVEYNTETAKHPDRPSKYHRPYQAEMLRCTAKRKVFRIGRQAGKTESLVISILFNLFTNADFKIVLITPYQAQIDMIFKRITDLIEQSATLTNSIKRSVKAPQYSIELYNNSYIKGFTAGTKSGGGAASARGQPANMLVFDEADYLNAADMDSAMAIITNYPNATVWMSSTPSGKRDKFYESCHDPEWKEYHLPSSVNPNWNSKLENFFRKSLTAVGYSHEVEADFGEQEEGVFQVQYVEAAQQPYEYKDMSPNPSWLYSVGVDWNSPSVGTTIRVVGFNPVNNKFYIVARDIVQRAGWTQLSACEAIAEINRKWRPFAIYVDQGYGATQIEILRKFGYDSLSDPSKGPKHIDSQLHKVVKPYSFGSKIETRDPFTKQKLSKHAKGFLVENSVRRFEAGDICFPESDKAMFDELVGYVVKNVTVTGQFVYGTNNDLLGDHNLDALMLALVGFTLEKSQIGKPTIREKITFTGIEHMPNQGLGEVRLRKDESMSTKPSTDRTEFSSQKNALPPKEKMRPWNEPEETRRQPRANPGQGTGRSSLFGGRGKLGGPPKRRNI